MDAGEFLVPSPETLTSEDEQPSSAQKHPLITCHEKVSDDNLISFREKGRATLKTCSTRHERYRQRQWIRRGRKQFRFIWRRRRRSCATTGGIFDFIPFSLHFLNALTSKLADLNYDLLPPAGDISRYNLGQWKEINVYCSKKGLSQVTIFRIFMN